MPSIPSELLFSIMICQLINPQWLDLYLILYTDLSHALNLLQFYGIWNLLATYTFMNFAKLYSCILSYLIFPEKLE